MAPAVLGLRRSTQGDTSVTSHLRCIVHTNTHTDNRVQSTKLLTCTLLRAMCPERRNERFF